MEQVAVAAQGRGGGQPPRPPPPPPPPQQQPLQPQQCPRCQSLNTKFCYYNNYSLSQPRFFCKACKRYWTQGGTLRNIPIGGNSRRGKRPRGSSSGSTVSSSGPQLRPRSEPPLQLQPQPQPRPLPATQEVVQLQTNLMIPTPPRMVQSTVPYYHGGGGGGIGGGYLSSFAAVHTLNPPPQPMNQSLNVGRVGEVVPSSNSALLSGFINTAASLGSQPHHSLQMRPSQFYQIGNNRVVGSLLRPEQGFNNNIPSTVANSSAAPLSESWTQGFIGTITSTGGITQNQSNTGGSGASMIPNHFPNLPGYGSPDQ
ncbi:hypothetical protein RIF29_35894 [Crotalaria pallida]|uniref:Dof zinc finger protein n=1 Tax=Crotalaria pallida TaxID=3830 RepID=A0AAN9HVF3_CROPI